MRFSRFVLTGFTVSVVFVSASLAATDEAADDLYVPPFGCPLYDRDCSGPSCPAGCEKHPLSEWPDAAKSPSAALPLQGPGPYPNGLGREWVGRINKWYEEGTASGLTQDRFRSFDNGHSGLRKNPFPQLKSEKPVPTYFAVCEDIFAPRVTMGVQSYGATPHPQIKIQGRSMIEFNSQSVIRAAYSISKTESRRTRSFYRSFYENNFLFIAPAVGTFTPERDSFTFLSPFYLHSIGASSSDSTLMIPFVFASAAMPPEIKTRILRKGLFVPTMMYLFKSHIAGDIKSTEAHVPAYKIAEAQFGYEGPTTFLDNMLNAAHDLTHIPPVARLKFSKQSGINDSHDYQSRPYYATNVYSFTAALRQGEKLYLIIDLRYSWTDEGKTLTSYYSKKLRGEGEIEYLNEEGSLLGITVPWSLTPTTHDYRSDFLFLVNDGDYYSAPAYVSVRHIHRFDPIIKGIKIK